MPAWSWLHSRATNTIPHSRPAHATSDWLSPPSMLQEIRWQIKPVCNPKQNRISNVDRMATMLSQCHKGPHTRAFSAHTPHHITSAKTASRQSCTPHEFLSHQWPQQSQNHSSYDVICTCTWRRAWNSTPHNRSAPHAGPKGCNPMSQSVTSTHVAITERQKHHVQ